jgi:hypothetical protein
LLHFKQVGLFLSDAHKEQVRQGLVMGHFLSWESGPRQVVGIGLAIFADQGIRHALCFDESCVRKRRSFQFRAVGPLPAAWQYN